MDWQTVLNIGFAVSGALGGWIMKMFYDEQRSHRQTLDKIPDVYARRDDVKESFDRVMAGLIRIEDKLDKKKDRSE